MEKLYFGKSTRKMHYFLLIYDISDDKRRTKLAKLMEGYGKRVQYSAFECWLNIRQYNKFMKEIEKIHHKEDNIRIYNLKDVEENDEKNMFDSIRFDVFIG